MKHEEKQDLKELLLLNDEQLTEQQEERLGELLSLKQKERKKKIADERESYKQLAADAVARMFELVQETSANLTRVKRLIYDEFETIIKMKQELFKVKSQQRSHTFMSADGLLRLTLGQNIIHAYDDTAGTGEAKIKQYLASMVTDQKSEQLVGLISDLLSKDKAGNYNPANIIKLQNRAEQSGDELFIDGVHIITKAYSPQPSKTYVRAEAKNQHGAWLNIPLGMTEA